MNKNFKNVGAVHTHTHTHTGNLLENKNKIKGRDIFINASNFGIKIENDEDIKTGRRPRRPAERT